jgi:GntR family transcriptional regulator/MocR family aminotransferase
MNSLQTINRKKRNTLICAVKEILGDRVKISGESAGTHTLLSVKQPGGDLVQQAIENNVKVYSLLPHWYDKIRHDPSQVIVGFNSIREKDIEEGVRRLEKAWFE